MQFGGNDVYVIVVRNGKVKKIINKIREYFRSKNAEQIFTLSLLIGCVGVMIFCAIVRLCGGLWFTADLESVPVPNEFWQTIIMNFCFIYLRRHSFIRYCAMLNGVSVL